MGYFSGLLSTGFKKDKEGKPFVAFFSLVFWMPYYYIKINKILSKAERTTERLTFSENFEKVALNTGLKTYIILLILTLLMVGLTVLALFSSKNKSVAILGVLFFGIALTGFPLALGYV